MSELLAGNRERSVRAFDMTFSAPKSVSLLWAFATDPVAEVVAAAHREAVAEALAFLEERAAVARVQAGGVRRRVATDGWAVAGFGHRTSREGDPQLHTHCLRPEPCAAENRRPLRGFGRRPAVRLVPGGRVCLPGPPAAVLVSSPRGGLGPGPPQHPGDPRLQS